MTLYTSDYLDFYLTLVGWLVSNGIWSVLVASGVIALPFIVIILQEWLRSRIEGKDEGNKGALSALRIEQRIWMAIVVIVFCAIPMIPVDLNTIQFDRTRSSQCQINVPLPNETGWGPSFTTLADRSAAVPLWWFFMHALTRAVTGAAVSAIPCGTDLRQMRMDIASTRISDAVLTQEVTDFSRDCYGPARASLFTQRVEMDPDQMQDVAWLGSNFFLATPGFYDSHRSRTPRNAWPYDAERDAGLTQVPDGGGYPRCDQWWSDGENGLRARLLRQVEPDLLLRFRNWASFLPHEAVDDAVIRAIAAPQQQTVNQGHVYTDYGGQIDMTLPNLATRIVSDVGLILGTFVTVPAMDVVRQALPMVLSLLKMALVISLPLILLIGTFDLKTIATVSCVQFAIAFCDFWFQLGRWLDSTMLNALYGWDAPHANFDARIGLENTFGDMLLSWFVMGTMFLVLPTFWVGSLAWVGVRAGAALQGLMGGTNDAKAAGARGGGLILR